MIVCTCMMWPRGNPAQSYELLHATISNQTSEGDSAESYMAHVLARPNQFMGITGYEADVEVQGHRRQAGFAPLLMSVLGTAHSDPCEPDKGIILPPSRMMAKILLREATEFEEIIKRGAR